MTNQFDVDKFISLIKSKESIWNYRSKLYGNKVLRTDDWLFICETMVEDFKEKSIKEQDALVREFQTKWKVLRDGFMRYLKNLKKKEESGKLRPGRERPHGYYKQLEFLKYLAGSRRTMSQNEWHAGKRRSDDETTETSSANVYKENVSEPKKKCTGESSRTVDDTDVDEDKQFLLSLLSDFRKIPEDQKLDAKGDIINIIRHYRNLLDPLQNRDSHFSHDITVLATTVTEPHDSPNSRDSFYYEYIKQSTRDNSPTEVKYDIDS